MVTITNEPLSNNDQEASAALYHSEAQPIALAAKNNIANQLLLSNHFVTHGAHSGLNPLVDAAAYLFSIAGKLKQIKSYRHLTKLRKELIREINTFQDVAKSHSYSSEYILVSRYALCATFDDIITNTPWGAQGQWDSQTLLAAFNQESINQERFFAILERLIKDPTLYIDVMEFMYICLSIGFKGHSRANEYNSYQLEQITNALYKRIRNFRGDFSKTLSPFPFKNTQSQKAPPPKNLPIWLTLLVVAGTSLMVVTGIRYMLGATSNEVYQELTRIGNITTHETPNQTAFA